MTTYIGFVVKKSNWIGNTKNILNNFINSFVVIYFRLFFLSISHTLHLFSNKKIEYHNKIAFKYLWIPLTEGLHTYLLLGLPYIVLYLMKTYYIVEFSIKRKIRISFLYRFNIGYSNMNIIHIHL